MTTLFPDLLLGEAKALAITCNLAAWWAGHRALAASEPQLAPIDLALLAGRAADRVAWAFASGYQAALRALAPELPPDAVVSLCATEEGGAHPRAIRTRLEDGTLTGDKRWATLGPDAGLFLVVASTGEGADGRNRLVVARVRADAPGITLTRGETTPFAPELAHASIHFERVGAEAILPGDGYARYLKPFRTIEDIYVHGALLGHLIGQARAAALPHALIERLLAAAALTRALAAADPAAPATHLALAGALASVRQLCAEFSAAAAGVLPPEAFARWERDLPLLDIAARARAVRSEAAWRDLARG